MDRTTATCGNCKYWGRDVKGACERVDFKTDPDKKFEIEVKVADDYNLNTWLITGKDFGCVLFESKRKVIAKE